MGDQSLDRKSQKEIDDILNSALDELEEDDDDAENYNQRKSIQKREEVSASASRDQKPPNSNLHTGNVQSEVENPDDILKSLEEALKHLNMHSNENEDSAKDPHRYTTEADVDETIKKTLEAMSQAGMGDGAGGIDDFSEDLMKQMMDEFEKLGGKEDSGEVMENMLQQLLSPELMYEPMQQICEKYPEWLATHKNLISIDEYNRYGAQYQCMQKVIHVYDTDPSNYQRLVELMQDMQEYGQVPTEIVKDLAPGLNFNNEGVPIMPGMGDGSLPNFQGSDPPNCCVQ